MIEITEDVLMTPVEVTVITEEEDTEEKQNIQVEVHETAKKGNQTSLVQFLGGLSLHLNHLIQSRVEIS